jgi:hypothetical protein
MKEVKSFIHIQEFLLMIERYSWLLVGMIDPTNHEILIIKRTKFSAYGELLYPYEEPQAFILTEHHIYIYASKF